MCRGWTVRQSYSAQHLGQHEEEEEADPVYLPSEKRRTESAAKKSRRRRAQAAGLAPVLLVLAKTPHEE